MGLTSHHGGDAGWTEPAEGGSASPGPYPLRVPQIKVTAWGGIWAWGCSGVRLWKPPGTAPDAEQALPQCCWKWHLQVHPDSFESSLYYMYYNYI